VNVIGRTPAEEPHRASESELRKNAEALAKLQAEMNKNELELLEKQVDLATKQLEMLRKANTDKDAVAAYEALVDVKRAELQLKRAAEKARTVLDGARLVAADGQFLGALGPSYEQNSIFCAYGAYGASYSDKSIWCSYGRYGATYQELSPFCTYSFKAPKLVVGDKVIATISVNSLGSPISVSPDLLKTIYGVRPEQK
jgi:hypothetical protein